MAQLLFQDPVLFLEDSETLLVVNGQHRLGMDVVVNAWAFECSPRAVALPEMLDLTIIVHLNLILEVEGTACT